MKGKVTAITGASAGIGWAVAEAIAEAGGDVVLLYNSNDSAITKGAKLAEQHGIKAKAYQLEVSDPRKVEKTINQIVEDFGRLDVFVANAGMAISKPTTETSIEGDQDPDGVFYQAKYAGHVFKKQGFGNLIITASTSAHIVNVPIDQPVYKSTKAAVRQLGRSLAREWRDFARVIIVSPGFFDTKMGAAPAVQNEAYRMTPLGRQGHVREIKGLFLYLASDASSYQTGSDTIIDGGYTLP
ncbi:Putative short-chain dehydrogenase/reductase SDR, NAD(P)-binding domain superfamily [Septoria linicola]|uniref:Short-chain dehydrogenase/reductase SDR, NAD(P)-binding domain superfamily n=1 Tax=Septoria linicola TaxID=215465 RepID=A0A9Q9EP00_9PEZI|nr:putative short-chain dehydrogenase/reductase SDR, NAD(P)-binding domain superfamily [Septoria linicola]USW55998.1 Putative short-chain dehydrogenase/reductase SDR, NAD(P)-binding domain superfamily [Septoria linicola]